MKALSQLLKSAKPAHKPASAPEKPARRLSDAELDYVAGGAGSVGSAGGGDC